MAIPTEAQIEGQAHVLVEDLSKLTDHLEDTEEALRELAGTFKHFSIDAGKRDPALGRKWAEKKAVLFAMLRLVNHIGGEVERAQEEISLDFGL